MPDQKSTSVADLRTAFPGYYRPDAAVFSDLWRNAAFVLDANVLLNFYRYSDDAQSVLFDILDKLRDRIWLPHQAGMEFHKNRLEVISAQADSYTLLTDEIEKSK